MQQLIRFGECELDLGKRTLRVGQEIKKLPKLPFLLLECLVRNPDRYLTNEELIEACWNGRIVEQNTFRKRISALYKLMGPARKFIDNHPSAGYRFTGLEADGLPESGSMSGPLETELPLLIVVLPFQISSALDQDLNIFSIGVAYNLARRLMASNKLRVVWPPSVIDVSTYDPIALGQKLNVNLVICGRMQREDTKVVVTAQLLQMPDAICLMDYEITSDERASNELERDLANRIVDRLHISIEKSAWRVMNRQYTHSAFAKERYQKGIFYWLKRDPESLRKAIGCFEQANLEDPEYALPYVGLADCYISLSAFGLARLKPDVGMRKAKAAIDRVLEHNNDLAEAFATQGSIAFLYEWDWAKAERAYKRAIQLNNKYSPVRHWYARLLACAERFEEAIREINLAKELDPLTPMISSTVGWLYHFAGNHTEAIRMGESARAAHPHFPPAHAMLGMAYEEMGDYEKAVACFEQAIELREEPIAMSALTHALALQGKIQEARKRLKELSAIHNGTLRYVSPYLLSIAHLALGEKELCLKNLRQAYHDRSEWLTHIRIDPRLKPLHQEKYYAELCRKIPLTSPIQKQQRGKS